nr:MAG TPA: hypothetical protein [Caudoviricetes sp.]
MLPTLTGANETAGAVPNHIGILARPLIKVKS